MRAVLPPRPTSSDPSVPILGDVADPKVGTGEVLLKIHAAALNRADLLQLRGLYPPPAGESKVPGLECAGEVEAVGEDVTGWQPGDRAMALLAGGGQAERAAVPSGQLMRIPRHLAFTDAAALPEAALTSWTNLVAEGDLEAGKTVLVTAAASGIGTFAVQVARELGARVLVAGRDLERLEALRPLGASSCFLLDDHLAENVQEATEGGVDLVMDLCGGPEIGEVLRSLRPGGRLVLVGVLAGTRAEIDLGDVLRRRLQIVGSVLRGRSRDEKSRLIDDFLDFATYRLDDGRLRPVIHQIYPFSQVAEAYAHLARGGVFGKLVLDLES